MRSRQCGRACKDRGPGNKGSWGINNLRCIAGLLLAALCWPAESPSAMEHDTGALAGLAGVPIRVFDLQADGVSEAFRDFMQTVPMTNDRQVPAKLVDDTVASLSFLKAATPPDVPAYFVAAYIHKTALVALPAEQRAYYAGRYGEAVYPQQVCPVFISSAGGGVPELLNVATNLPATWFGRTGGAPSAYQRLFALTEASHCGFIARELANPTVLPAGLGPEDLRTILEALGDFEATAVMRTAAPGHDAADESDVLFAARLLAALLLDRDNAYTAVPGLLHEYGRIGVAETHRRLPEIRQSVQRARDAVRRELEHDGRSLDTLSLPRVAAALEDAQRYGRLEAGDPLATTLIDLLVPAIRLLEGDRSIRLYRPHLLEQSSRFVTLTMPRIG